MSQKQLAPGWEKIVNENGEVWWVEPGTNFRFPNEPPPHAYFALNPVNTVNFSNPPMIVQEAVPGQMAQISQIGQIETIEKIENVEMPMFAPIDNEVNIPEGLPENTPWGALRFVSLPSQPVVTLKTEAPGRCDGVWFGRAQETHPVSSAFRDNGFISGFHCCVFLDDKRKAFVLDNSSNGTLINNVKVGKGNTKPIKFSDVITLCDESNAKRVNPAFCGVIAVLERIQQ